MTWFATSALWCSNSCLSVIIFLICWRTQRIPRSARSLFQISPEWFRKTRYACPFLRMFSLKSNMPNFRPKEKRRYFLVLSFINVLEPCSARKDIYLCAPEQILLLLGLVVKCKRQLALSNFYFLRAQKLMKVIITRLKIISNADWLLCRNSVFFNAFFPSAYMRNDSAMIRNMTHFFIVRVLFHLPTRAYFCHDITITFGKWQMVVFAPEDSTLSSTVVSTKNSWYKINEVSRYVEF